MNLGFRAYKILFLFFSSSLIIYPQITFGAKSITKGNKMELSLKKFVMARYDKKSNQFNVEHLTPAIAPNDYFKDVELSPKGQIYFITGKGIFKLSHDNLKSEQISNFIGNDLYIDPNEQFYSTTVNGLFKSKDLGKTFEPKTISGFKDSIIKSVVIDPKGTQYFATESGLLISDDKGKSFKNYLIENENPASNKNHFYKCFLSKKGDLACTTWFGVLIFNPKDKTFRKTKLEFAAQTEIAFDSQGRLYGVDGPSNSIIRSDEKLENFKVYKEEWGLENLIISNLLVDSKDQIFAFSYNGLYLKSPNTKKFENLNFAVQPKQLFPNIKLIEHPSGELFLFSWIHPASDLPD